MSGIRIDPDRVIFSVVEKKRGWTDAVEYDVNVYLSESEMDMLETSGPCMYSEDPHLHYDGSDFEKPDIKLLKSKVEDISRNYCGRFCTINIYVNDTSLYIIKNGTGKFDINFDNQYFDIFISMRYDHEEEMIL
jgi:hypothetical protein